VFFSTFFRSRWGGVFSTFFCGTKEVLARILVPDRGHTRRKKTPLPAGNAIASCSFFAVSRKLPSIKENGSEKIPSRA
jgi:hypothetical protein